MNLTDVLRCFIDDRPKSFHIFSQISFDSSHEQEECRFAGLGNVFEGILTGVGSRQNSKRGFDSWAQKRANPHSWLEEEPEKRCKGPKDCQRGGFLGRTRSAIVLKTANCQSQVHM